MECFMYIRMHECIHCAARTHTNRVNELPSPHLSGVLFMLSGGLRGQDRVLAFHRRGGPQSLAVSSLNGISRDFEPRHLAISGMAVRRHGSSDRKQTRLDLPEDFRYLPHTNPSG